MKTQQALEPNKMETEGTPVFVEAEKLLERMEDMTRSIARRAYEFFEERGRKFGNELEDWFRAESEFMRQIPVTMKEGDNQITVHAEVPGFKADEIKISAEARRLMIEGKSEEAKEETSDKVVFSERSSNRFCRSFTLPAEIDPSKVTASLKDGMLEIALPKVPERHPVGVEVKTS